MSSSDPRIARAVKILETAGQRQDSLSEQLDDVMQLARAAGCYDALDFIQRSRTEASTGRA